MLWHEFTHYKQFPWKISLLQCNRKVMTAWQICSIRGKKVFPNADILFCLEASASSAIFFVDNLTNLTALDQTLWLLYSDLCVRLLSADNFQCTHERLAVKGQEQVLPLSLMMTAHLKVPAGMTRSRQTQTGVTVFARLNGFKLFLITLLMSSLLHVRKSLPWKVALL